MALLVQILYLAQSLQMAADTVQVAASMQVMGDLVVVVHIRAQLAEMEQRDKVNPEATVPLVHQEEAAAPVESVGLACQEAQV